MDYKNVISALDNICSELSRIANELRPKQELVKTIEEPVVKVALPKQEPKAPVFTDEGELIKEVPVPQVKKEVTLKDCQSLVIECAKLKMIDRVTDYLKSIGVEKLNDTCPVEKLPKIYECLTIMKTGAL